MTQQYYPMYIASCDAEGGIFCYRLYLDGSTELLGKTPLDRPMYMSVHQNIIHIILRSPFSASAESGYVNYEIHNEGKLGNQSKVLPTKGIVACHLAVGEAIYCANYVSGSVIKLPEKLFNHTGSSIHPTRQASAHPHQTVFTPDGKYICVADLGMDEIFIYDKDLNFVSSAGVPKGHGARHIVFSADGRYAYCHNDPVNWVDPGGLKAVKARAHANSIGVEIEWFANTIDAYGTIRVYSSFTYDGYTRRGIGTLENGSMMIDDSFFTLTVAISQKGTNGAKARKWMEDRSGGQFSATTSNYCMTFVSWTLAEAGIDGPKEHYAGRAIDWYNERGKYRLVADGYTPNVGDTIFMGIYTEPGGRKVEGAYHAAIVIAFVPPDTVYTIEGGGAGSNVKICKRSLSDMRENSRIYGIGRNGGVGHGTVPTDSDIVDKTC